MAEITQKKKNSPDLKDLRYDPKKIEKKWQKFWAGGKIFKASDESDKSKFYCLDMFPYPSAYGLHAGHFKGYTFSDVVAKKRKMDGFEVMHPMGFDAFGLPAENFAIKVGIHPAVTTKKAIKNIKGQMDRAGLGYDWDRNVITCQSDYYRWTQWMFLKLYEHGLAYRKKAPVNFCPSCKTVLANEQVVDGSCERCSTQVQKEYLEQWFFRITDYAQRLIDDLEKIDWPEKIKTMQRNWIGRSEGTEIRFTYYYGGPGGERESNALSVFTTRVDTLFGCTYVVIAPEHPLVEQLKPWISNWNEVEAYVKAAKNKNEIERLAEDKEKTGVELKGVRVVNPVNNSEVPVYISDYVLMEYGTGAVMAVPAHDQRDFLFAAKYGLPVIEVVKPVSGETALPGRAYEEDGILVNSEVFSGLASEAARKDITKYLEVRNKGKLTIHYKLRDWLISRQRYWGAPIPMINCGKCGWQPVPIEDLPVTLPKIKDFIPTGEGKSPLAKNKKFVAATCPKCKGKAVRETDTMDTFVCSSWYYLRYTDPGNEKIFADPAKIEKWMPVDLYVGGVEHALLHLLYSRFFTKALNDFGYVGFTEPFSKLFSIGTIYYQGAKMSKSKGNVVNPDNIIKQYGADTFRIYELFMGPLDQAGEWSDKGITGVHRFLWKVWGLQNKVKEKTVYRNAELESLIHRTIKKVTEGMDSFRLNTAVSALMILANEMDKEPEIGKSDYLKIILMLAPMAPHMSEEIWHRFNAEPGISEEKGSVFCAKWPEYDPEMAKERMITLVVQINGKVRDKLEAEAEIGEEQAKELAKNSKIVQKWIAGKEIRKIIYVPGRLVNILV